LLVLALQKCFFHKSALPKTIEGQELFNSCEQIEAPVLGLLWSQPLSAMSLRIISGAFFDFLQCDFHDIGHCVAVDALYLTVVGFEPHPQIFGSFTGVPGHAAKRNIGARDYVFIVDDVLPGRLFSTAYGWN
jgi:hypothetical protein